jgi:hypothetical protein
MRIDYNTPNQHVPVYLYDAARQPVTGFVPAVGQVQLSLDGAAWTDYIGTWSEDADGVYDLEFDQSETAAFSFVWVKVDAPGAERVMFSVDIGDRVIVNTATAVARRFPIYLTDITNTPLPGLNLVGASQVQIGKNGGGMVDVAGALAEVGGANNGQGGYYYEATIPEINTVGYDILKVFPTGLPQTRYVYVWNVIPVPSSGGGGGVLIGSNILRGGA